MGEGKVAVKFEPQGKTVRVPRGTTIRDAAAQAGLVIDSPCGGHGTCGKCKVRVANHAGEVSAAEFMTLSREEIGKGIRLACQSVVCEPMTVEVPESSLLGSDYKILTATGEAGPGEYGDPPVHKQFVELAKPSLDDDTADVDRLQAAVGAFDTELVLLRDLPRRLRQADFAGTAVLTGSRLIDFEPGDTESRNYALAFDIGTTTLVAELIEVSTGRQCGVVSRMNPQTSYGDDILSRILYTRQKPDGLRQLHDDVIAAANDMIRELTSYGHVDRERIYEATFSGNTTMQHLL
ncbi:MAG: 2Fe-2S iron-sulfur cluster binding domain-containing protein, partial [Candidatus Hydrogenedentes bacterium]|nr:2Fe-2S iron-sulfur cluster binding domain-containing protein [Candidatus Hydrogenedentota bacterium]